MNFYETGISWEKAECKGLDTNAFYFAEEKRLPIHDKMIAINSLRTICTMCPIWKECLSWAFKNEEYGVWGGMTAVERKSFSSPLLTDIKYRTLQELKYFGISHADIKEVKQMQKTKKLPKG